MHNRWRTGRARHSPTARIWVLIALMFALAAGPVLLTAGGDAFIADRWAVGTLIALVVLFGLAEVFSVHLHFTKNSHSVSLFEIPLTLGLFFAPPPALLGAHAIGAALALWLHRRQTPLKLTFNLALFALGDGLAALTFRAMAGDAGTFDSSSMLAAGCAVLVASMTSALLVIVVVSVAEGRWLRSRLLSSLGFNAATAVVSTSLALTAVAVITAYPAASWLLLIPTVGLYLTNHAYARERRRHQGIEFLHDSTRLIHQSPELETALTQLVRHAREAFRAGFAELVYLPAGGAQALDVIADGTEVATRDGTFDDLGLTAMRDHAYDAGAPALFGRHSASEPLLMYLDRHALHEVILAPLAGEARQFGVLVIGNRRADVARFDRGDVALWETLAVNVAAALENGHLEQSLDRLRQLERRLVHQANHDSLTQLPNRALFVDRVTQVLAAGQAATVLFIDLDDFKTVNDSLGHSAGDELLMVVAQRLSLDLPPGALAARLGGDEFAVLLTGVDDFMDGALVAQALLQSLAAPMAIAGRAVPVRASIGLAVSSTDHDASELLRNADIAMYAAKSQGKHRVAVYERALHEEALRRYRLASDLERAIHHDELVVHFQPILDLQARRVVAAEALLRWEHPSHGIVAAGAFIDIAEESDSIVAIRRIVVDQVCRYLAANPGAALPVWVNLSTRDLLEPALASELDAAVAAHGVDPSLLVFEVTEGLMIADPDAASRVLGEVRALGARIALDDFGTGYSSLSTLRHLPVDVLKIAKPFVDDIASTAESTAYVEAILRMGQVLGLTIVAEGIERDEQVERLIALGCDLGQGFLFSPAVEVHRLLEVTGAIDGLAAHRRPARASVS